MFQRFSREINVKNQISVNVSVEALVKCLHVTVGASETGYLYKYVSYVLI